MMMDGNKVRDPGMVKRSDPSFPCASLDAGLGLRLAYAVDQEHKNSFLPQVSLSLIIVAERDGVNLNVTNNRDRDIIINNSVADFKFCPTGSAKHPPYVLLLIRTQSQPLIRVL